MFLGSLLMVYGSEEQKAKYMPPIAAGEIDWAQGYSEPGSGSDLASLQCRAVRDGDEFVVNGQKLWSQPLTSDIDVHPRAYRSGGAQAPTASTFLMIEDLTDPGITMAALPNMAGGYPGNGETFFHDVRVPVIQPDRRGEPGLVRRHDAHGLRPRQPLRHRRGPPGPRPPR